MSGTAPAIPAPEGGMAQLLVTLSRARDAATTVAYVLGEDGDPATAELDTADHDGDDGALTILAGATEAAIRIAVHDDEDIEPPQETFVLTLVEPDTAEFGLGASTVHMTVDEGVCDPTREVGNALRRSLPCASVSDTELAARRTLALSDIGPVALRSIDLSGLVALEMLDLSDNLLTTLTAENGTPPAMNVSVAAGRMASDAVRITQAAPGPVRVRFGSKKRWSLAADWPVARSSHCLDGVVSVTRTGKPCWLVVGLKWERATLGDQFDR